MILSKPELLVRLTDIFGHDEYELVNPASVDIRLGSSMKKEARNSYWKNVDLFTFTEHCPYILYPGEFCLISTYEKIKVPLDIAMELKLKSTRARQGFDHSLAFWIDPGWDGYLTMEVKNITQFTPLAIWYGMRFGQAILHKLTKPLQFHEAYMGKYQYAPGVENAKDI